MTIVANPNAIPARITSAMLYEKAAANRLPERVVFEGHVYDGTLQHANNPIEAIEGFKDAVISTFDVTERTEQYPGFTFDDLAVACNVVVNRLEGFTSQVMKRSPMDKPATRRVPVGYSMATGEMEYTVVPDGATSLPWRGKPWIAVGVDGRGVPYIQAQVIRGDQSHLEGLFAFVRDWANANSIYLNQAIDTNFNFLNRTKFDPTKVALTQAMKVALDLFVRGPLKYRAALDAKRQDPKTAVLFEGPPGGGKTMTVTLCEFQVLVAGGVVIHVDPAMGIKGLDKANVMATRLMDAGHMVMICFEDVEKLALESREKVLEILDGAGAKTARRIIIGTTNFLEQIDPAMTRHGRFDDVLHCGLPDQQAFEHLIRVVFDPEDIGDIDFDVAFPHYEGYSYATIASAASRVIRAAINRLEGDLTNFKVTTQDLIDAALMVRAQHSLLAKEVVKQPPYLDEWFRDRYTELEDRTVERILDRVGETVNDSINYSYIGVLAQEGADSAIEGRLDGARIEDKHIRTN